MTPRSPWVRGAIRWAVILAVLAVVFTAYTRPGFLVTLANMLWSCF